MEGEDRRGVNKNRDGGEKKNKKRGGMKARERERKRRKRKRRRRLRRAK